MIALGLVALGVLAVPGGPWVGFVSHYPFLPENGPAYRDSGATVALTRCPWSEVERQPEHFDFGSLDRELVWSAQQGVKLLIVFECGPAHAPNWVVEQVRAAGEGTVDPDGRPGPYPSIFSPTYARLIDRFVSHSAGYSRQHPLASRILGYNNGCEWWYPDAFAFSEPDRAAFEAAMIKRYGSAAAARKAWGLAGEDKLERPRVIFEGGGGADHFAELIPADERLDACWMTHDEHVPVTAGQRYTFSADVRVTDRRRGAGYLQIAWLGDRPQPLRVVNSTMVTRGDWARLTVSDTAPEAAKHAWLLLKSCAVAEVQFRRPAFSGPDGGDLLAGRPLGGPAWTPQTWCSADPKAVAYDFKDGVATLRYLRPDASTVSAAWVDDWWSFMDGAVAEFIGSIADRLRAADPPRPIVSYLTNSFEAPFGWDDALHNHIDPWRVFSAWHYDGLGMQLSAADGDDHHVTAGIDLVRRLGEPWLIDLQDFTAGIHVGREAMTRTTLAGIAAGARGVVYYAWGDPGVPDYSFRDGWPVADIRRMVDAGKELLARQATARVPIDVAVLHPAVPPLPGRGEPDPGRIMLLYAALRRLGLGVVLVPRGVEPPRGVPLLSVDDVPAALRPEVRRSTEAGNTPPMFKLLPTPQNQERLRELTRRLAARLGRVAPQEGGERFPWVDADGQRQEFVLPDGEGL
jgi:hypothetical protein